MGVGRMRYMGEPKGETRVCPACNKIGFKKIATDYEFEPGIGTMLCHHEDAIFTSTPCYKVVRFSFEKCPYCAGLGYKEVEY